MIPYFLLLLMPCVFALFNTRRLSLPLWYATFFVYVVFVGFRFEVGPDWVQYKYIHNSLAYFSFWDVIIQVEPLSYLLFWLSQTSGNEVYISNIVAALIVMTGVFSFARRAPNPWLAVVAATPYFIIVMGMSGVRQAMAAGVILFLFSRWERYSLLKRGGYILVSALFHTSALVNAIFLIIKLNIAMRYKLVLGTVIFLITLYLSLEVSMYSENMLRYQQRYIEDSFVIESIGSLYHITMIAIPAILGFIFKRRILAHMHNSALLHFGLYAALSLFLLNFISTTVASRLTVYLYFVPMMVYPAIVASMSKRTQLAGAFLVVAVHMLILLGWFSLANVSFTYIPYKNILFNE